MEGEAKRCYCLPGCPFFKCVHCQQNEGATSDFTTSQRPCVSHSPCENHKPFENYFDCFSRDNSRNRRNEEQPMMDEPSQNDSESIEPTLQNDLTKLITLSQALRQALEARSRERQKKKRQKKEASSKKRSKKCPHEMHVTPLHFTIPLMIYLPTSNAAATGACNQGMIACGQIKAPSCCTAQVINTMVKEVGTGRAEPIRTATVCAGAKYVSETNAFPTITRPAEHQRTCLPNSDSCNFVARHQAAPLAKNETMQDPKRFCAACGRYFRASCQHESQCICRACLDEEPNMMNKQVQVQVQQPTPAPAPYRAPLVLVCQDTQTEDICPDHAKKMSPCCCTYQYPSACAPAIPAPTPTPAPTPCQLMCEASSSERLMFELPQPSPPCAPPCPPPCPPPLPPQQLHQEREAQTGEAQEEPIRTEEPPKPITLGPQMSFEFTRAPGVYRLALPQHKDVKVCRRCKFDPSPLIDHNGDVFCPGNCGCCLCAWRERPRQLDDITKTNEKVTVCNCRNRLTLFDESGEQQAMCSSHDFDFCPCRVRVEERFLEMYGHDMWTQDESWNKNVYGKEVNSTSVHRIDKTYKQPPRPKVVSLDSSSKSADKSESDDQKPKYSASSSSKEEDLRKRTRKRSPRQL